MFRRKQPTTNSEVRLKVSHKKYICVNCQALDCGACIGVLCDCKHPPKRKARK